MHCWHIHISHINGNFKFIITEICCPNSLIYIYVSTLFPIAMWLTGSIWLTYQPQPWDLFIAPLTCSLSSWWPLLQGYLWGQIHIYTTSEDTQMLSQEKAIILLYVPRITMSCRSRGWVCKMDISGLILGLCPANERCHCKAMPSLIGLVQT